MLAQNILDINTFRDVCVKFAKLDRPKIKPHQPPGDEVIFVMGFIEGLAAAGEGATWCRPPANEAGELAPGFIIYGACIDLLHNITGDVTESLSESQAHIAVTSILAKRLPCASK